jgi:hypothetical protein
MQDQPKMLQSVAITPSTGKTHLAIALGVAACHAGQRVLFATANDWVARRQDATNAAGFPPSSPNYATAG